MGTTSQFFSEEDDEYIPDVGIFSLLAREYIQQRWCDDESWNVWLSTAIQHMDNTV